jgi:DNA-binding MarR family transcriptional regulator
MTDKRNLRFSLLMGRFIRKIMILDRNEKNCHGVTLSQHYAIDALYRKKILTMNELSRELGLAVSTLTRIVDVLVRDGFVSRSHSMQDRRKVCIELTARGITLAESLNSCTEMFWHNILETIPEDKKPAIVEDLKILLNALDGAERPCDSHAQADKQRGKIR